MRCQLNSIKGPYGPYHGCSSHTGNDYVSTRLALWPGSPPHTELWLSRPRCDLPYVTGQATHVSPTAQSQYGGGVRGM